MASGGSLGASSRGWVITSEEIEATDVSTVWEVLRIKLRFATYRVDNEGRPILIQARGRSSIMMTDKVLVFVDHMRLEDIRFLEDMVISQVERIEVLSGIDATTFFGTNAGDGVIHIITRTR